MSLNWEITQVYVNYTVRNSYTVITNISQSSHVQHQSIYNNKPEKDQHDQKVIVVVV